MTILLAWNPGEFNVDESRHRFMGLRRQLAEVFTFEPAHAAPHGADDERRIAEDFQISDTTLCGRSHAADERAEFSGVARRRADVGRTLNRRLASDAQDETTSTDTDPRIAVTSAVEM
jgi:hypothetical protein